MSALRIAVRGEPVRFVDQGPASAGRHRTYLSVPAETVGNMRPVLQHGAYLENRHRTKPNNPFSIHIENRR